MQQLHNYTTTQLHNYTTTQLTKTLSLLSLFFFFSLYSVAQTDGQVLTRVNGGSSWADLPSSLPINVVSAFTGSNYTLNTIQHTVIFDLAPTGFVILPSASNNHGQLFYLINRSGTSINLNTNIRTPNGSTTSTILSGSSISIQADGGGSWYLIGN